MFPTLGAADSNGMRPIYIGEKHDDPEHIWALIRNFNIIAPVIDVFFIEHYYRGDSPVGGTTTQIDAYLVNRQFRQTMRTGLDVRKLATLCEAARIPLVGVDRSRPPNKNPVLWRISRELNTYWYTSIFRYKHMHFPAAEMRFVVYGGMAHGFLLGQTFGLLPTMASYAWDGQRYRKYGRVSAQGEPQWLV